jgi:hypothetical protein
MCEQGDKPIMRRLLPCLCLVLLCGGASLVRAQEEFPKFDFTAAFTWNRFELPSGGTRRNFPGATLAPAWNINKYWALEGDLTYTAKTLEDNRTRFLVTYLFGPRFTHRGKRYQPFMHAIFGGGHLNGFGAATNGWAGKMGGGLDIVAGKHVAVRVVQVDYYRYHGHVNVGTQRLNNAAFTFGVRLF